MKSAITRQRHVIDLIRDHLEEIEAVPLQLPNPCDPRALRVAEKLISTPGSLQTLTYLCKSVGASRTTAERLFLEETGLTFGKRRQQLRTMHSLRLLAEEAAVTNAAPEAGYSTPSAFIALFRRALGNTPASYIRKNSKKHASKQEIRYP